MTVQDSQKKMRPMKVRSEDELELYRRIVEDHDPQAMATFFETRQKELIHFAYKYCKSDEAAVDFVQDAFAIILKTQKQQRDGTGNSFCKDFRIFDTWVHSIVRNNVFRSWEKAKHQIDMSTHFDTAAESTDVSGGFGQAYHPDPDELGLPEFVSSSISGGFEDPLLYVLKREREGHIGEILSAFRLKATHNNEMRAALAFGEGQIYQEIAEAEGIPVGTVRSRIHRGRQAIKEVCVEALEPV